MPEKKVFLILDNLRVHHSKLVKARVVERMEKIGIFYLPSYSPELNPEERLNADLKHVIGTKTPVRTKAKSKLAATEHMVKLDWSSARVKSFFQNLRVKYATSNFKLHLAGSIRNGATSGSIYNSRRCSKR